MAASLKDAGLQLKDKRVERLWRREGLKVLGLCARLRIKYRNHLGSYDFVHHRTDDGRAFWTLNILDEHRRERRAIRVKRKLSSTEVIGAPTDLFIPRGVPVYIWSDNGPKFIVDAVWIWIKAVGAKMVYIKPKSPYENGYCESFNGCLQDQSFNCKVFYALREAQVIIENGVSPTTSNAPTELSAIAHRFPKQS